MSAQIKTTAHGGCPHDCPDTCSMVYEVENGKLKSVKGNADHPMTRGGLCVKLKDYKGITIQIVYYTHSVVQVPKVADNLKESVGMRH